MKKIFCLILCLSLGLTLISCSSNKNGTTESNKSEEATENSSDSTTKQDEEKSNTQENQKSISDSKNQTTDNKKQNSNLITLTTYTADEQTLEIKTLSTIQVEESLSLQEKLDKLANELSTKAFNGLPINVVRVETINGIKKATINLEDSKNNPTIGWKKTYLQGSTSSTVTSKELIETFRQKSYPGDWIGYVEFLYNNNPIESEHADDLSNTIKLK